MQYNIAVSVGHHARNPGQKSNNSSEYSEMVTVAALVVKFLSENGHTAHLIGANSLRQKIADVNTLCCDCAIELHLNSGGGRGFETLYMTGSARGKELATQVHQSVKKVLYQQRDRGIKIGWHHQDPTKGMNYFLEKTNCPAVITELYFIDNQAERELFLNNTDFYKSISARIAVGILMYLHDVKK